VLFINGIPLIVVECKKGSSNCANPMSEAFEQLQRYMNQRQATAQHGLKEGEPRLFHTNLLLRSSTDLSDYKILLINDRVDLEDRLARTATPIGGKVHTIDEAHRTQGSDLSDNIFEAFPNAARIAFTGTPLITDRHGEKKTKQRFSEYIDTYRLMDAVGDGTTLQILYEGRTADAALNDKHGFETQFENLFKDRSPDELLAIKKKYGATGDLLEAEQRIFGDRQRSRPALPRPLGSL
jgi:type I site-specific restriction-modification system R (restriction) subunit